MKQSAYTRAWVDARSAFSYDVSENVLSKTIRWMMEDPRYIERKEDTTMALTQWTIQLRFDPLGDNNKKDKITATVTRAASHLLAVANLLEGPVRSNIAVYNDDFILARSEIELVPDTLGEALRAFGGGEDAQQETLSDEMSEFVRGLSKKQK
jgi:hypothetical protein